MKAKRCRVSGVVLTPTISYSNDIPRKEDSKTRTTYKASSKGLYSKARPVELFIKKHQIKASVLKQLFVDLGLN